MSAPGTPYAARERRGRTVAVGLVSYGVVGACRQAVEAEHAARVVHISAQHLDAAGAACLLAFAAVYAQVGIYLYVHQLVIVRQPEYRADGAHCVAEIAVGEPCPDGYRDERHDAGGHSRGGPCSEPYPCGLRGVGVHGRGYVKKYVPRFQQVGHRQEAGNQAHYIYYEQVVAHVAVRAVAARAAAWRNFAAQENHAVLNCAHGAEGGAICTAEQEGSRQPEEDGAYRNGNHRRHYLRVGHQRGGGVRRLREAGVGYGRGKEEQRQDDSYGPQVFHRRVAPRGECTPRRDLFSCFSTVCKINEPRRNMQLFGVEK